MKRDEILERMANGLRDLKEFPDALIFSTDEDWVWDEETILGIPVFHTDIFVEFVWNSQISTDCPFLPIWKKERSCTPYKSKKFFDGWNNF